MLQSHGSGCVSSGTLGFIVLINPWWSEPTKLFDIIGGMLLFSSLVSIVRLILVWPIKSE